MNKILHFKTTYVITLKTVKYIPVVAHFVKSNVASVASIKPKHENKYLKKNYKEL
jgi:hypothetical protein